MTAKQKPRSWILTKKGKKIAKEYKRLYPIVKKFVKDDFEMRKYL